MGKNKLRCGTMETKVEERTLYPAIVNYLKSLGFEAIGESSIIDKGKKRHPDILFKYNNEVFVVEVKIGLKSEGFLNAIAQAYDYANKLGTKNIIILNYPENVRQTIHSFERIDNLALDTEVQASVLTEFWTKSLTCTPRDLFVQIKTMLSLKKQEIDFKTIVKLIRDYVRELNEVIKRINTDNLIKEVVNKLDLFAAIGEIKDKETAKKQIINLASYLLFNQLLFYHIYTKKTKDCELPELNEIEKLKDLQAYFDLITRIDYKAIYKINLLGHIEENPEVINVLNNIIKAIKLLRAEYITHDLAGRFFHDLIPHEVRKVLAAFYTHPIAAEILSGLTIDDWDESVIDPACGSGTLLVSAYKRKMDIYTKLHGYHNLKEIHKKFIENDITGIDIMPFAAHLSAINLTLQNIEYPTNTVRIATQDALDLANQLKTERFRKEGIEISSYTETIQKTLTELVLKKEKKGAVSPEGRGSGFILKPVDVVIMNPPYSDREKMPKDMRDKLKKNKILGKICGHQVNLWGYFIALAHYLLKDGGKIGAVIPINIARGKATEKIRNFLLDNYHIKYIIKPVGDLAFSEGALFRDVLLIAEKRKPKDDEKTWIIFVKKSIRDMNIEEVDHILKLIESPKDEIITSEYIDMFSVKRSDLLENKNNLMRFLSFSNIKTLFMFNEFIDKIKKCVKLKNMDMSLLREGFGLRPEGISSLIIITRPIDESRIKRAYLVVDDDSGSEIKFKIKSLDIGFKIPKEKTIFTLRSLTGINTMDITNKEDYLISEYDKILDSVKVYSKYKGKLDFKKIKITIDTIGSTNLCIPNRINLSSPNTYVLATFSENKFTPVGKFFLFKTKTIEEAKIYTLYLNSIVSIIQILTNTTEATGTYFDIRKSDLENFLIFDVDKLSQEEKQTLLNLFEKLKNVEFPSILDQLENRFRERVELDKTILQILGFSKREINEWLPKLYDAVVEELKAMKNTR